MDQNFNQNQAQSQAKKKKSGGAIKVLVAVVVIIIIAGVTLFTCVRTVPTGYTGILTTFGKVEKSNLEAGLHIIMPWQNIVLMDNRVQKATLDTQAFSSDIQQVDLRLTVTYEIDRTVAGRLYENVGVQYYDKIIAPQLLENTKAVFAQYTAEGLIGQRDQLAVQVADMMSEDVQAHGIVIKGVAIENIDFSDSFTDAIEAKQVATQELQRAETQQEQATMEAQAAADRERIAAEAKADVAKIEADADAYAITAKAAAEAEANAKIADSLSEALIEYTQAQLWNGELPTTYVGSSDALPVLNIGADETENKTE